MVTPRTDSKAAGEGASWRGSVLVSAGHALYIGRAGDTRVHRHHALQLVVGMEGSFEAQLGRASVQTFDALLVAADSPHRIEGHGLQLAIYYVDGSSLEGRALARWLDPDTARTLPGDVADLRELVTAAIGRPSSAVLPFVREQVAAQLRCPSTTSLPGDSVVESATSLLEGSIGAPPPVPDLAVRLGVRQRELSSRFRAATGLTIRRYVLWLRIKAAVSALAELKTLTEAAHAAGFADAAHLSRTFLQMFGVPPSESVAASDVEVVARS